MEVVFGVQSGERSLRVELDEKEVEALRAKIEEIFAEGTSVRILWVKDTSGRTIGIPVDKLTYVELGAEKAGRRVGFASSG